MTQREKVAVRLSPDEIAELDRLAKAEHRSRSEMIRVLLIEAARARARTNTATQVAVADQALTGIMQAFFEREERDTALHRILDRDFSIPTEPLSHALNYAPQEARP